ncbi:hypothetical protein D3C78_886880 [compost metagenome]
MAIADQDGCNPLATVNTVCLAVQTVPISRVVVQNLTGKTLNKRRQTPLELGFADMLSQHGYQRDTYQHADQRMTSLHGGKQATHRRLDKTVRQLPQQQGKQYSTQHPW